MSESEISTTEHDVSAIEKWMKTEVKLAPGTRLIRTPNAGFGLEADVNLAKDAEEEAVRVPHKLVLTSARVKELAEEDEQLQRWIAGKNLADTDVLHRGLLYLWLEAPSSSPWRHYFDNLPRDVGLPFSLTVHEMEALDSAGISIMYPALLRRVACERAYLKFKKLGLREISLEDWLLPHQWISSRALAHPQSGHTCVVPIVDLANHSSTKANVRYEVDNETGDFLLLKVPYAADANRPSSGSEELLLDYGDRSSAEFVYNYGFVPEDRSADDFDELFRAFYPGGDRVRDVLDPSRVDSEMLRGDKIDVAHAYDALLDFFGDEFPQILRIVRLPKSEEGDKESSRYKFHNDFIMVLAAHDELEVRDVDGRTGLFVDDAELTPNDAFEVIMKTQNEDIIRKARQLVSRLCRVFAAQLAELSDLPPIMKALANRERELYEQYAAAMAKPEA